jgi:hypothetical protein
MFTVRLLPNIFFLLVVSFDLNNIERIETVSHSLAQMQLSNDLHICVLYLNIIKN